MAKTRRDINRENMTHEILDIARRHMAMNGAASLSLRAIATEMRMTAPALYRYFANRDELVTTLIIEAFNSLAEALESARDSCQPDDFKRCIRRVGMAYRQWAITNPQDYTLIFGTPIPGYEAPKDQVSVPSKRALGVLIRLIEDTRRAGLLNPVPAYLTTPEPLASRLKAWIEAYNLPGMEMAVHLSLAIWSRLHGIILLEIFGHLDYILENGEALYETEISAFLEQIGMV